MAVQWKNKRIAERIQRQAQGVRQVGAFGVVEGGRLDDGRFLNEGFWSALLRWLRPARGTKASLQVISKRR